MTIPEWDGRPDVAALTAILDGRWAAVRHEARASLAELPTPPAEGDLESRRAAVLTQLQRLAEAGHPLLGFPKEYGGQGDVGGAVVSFEMLGFGDLSLLVKTGVQWGLFGGAVQALGTRRHHDALLPSIMNLDLLGCFAMTETGHGSDVASLRTTATFDQETDEFVVHTPDLSARKDYIGNAARDGRMAVVFAQLEPHGVHAFLVPLRDAEGAPMPGVTIEDCGEKGGLNGVDNGRIWFDQVRIPRDNLLDRYAAVAADGTYTSPIDNPSRRFFTMLGALIRGRISVAGGAGSAAKTALTLAVRYGEKRRQFPNPATGEEMAVLDYLAHQRKLLPALATTYALHFAQEELVRTLDELYGTEADETRQRELESRAAGIKAAGTWHASDTIQTCREACGGAGYLAENRLTRLKADTDVFTTFEGDNTVLLQLVAKGLLTEYRHDVEELGTLGLARFVAERFAEAVIERTPARKLGRPDPLDPDWQRQMFADREEHVVEGLARRLRRAEHADDAFAVFNQAQDQLLKAARVHIDRVLLEAFNDALADSPDPLLGRVRDLYALSVIEADRAWFLEHGRIGAETAKSLVKTVDELCGFLRPHARALTDAFAIPEPLLDVPMLRN